MKRLRKVTGNKDLVSQAQIDAKDTKPTQLAYDTLVRPIVLFKEPILLVFNIYLALIYGLSCPPLQGRRAMLMLVCRYPVPLVRAVPAHLHRRARLQPRRLRSGV